MRGSLSLRLRLFGLILGPLVMMAVLLGYWRYVAAQETTKDLFDRSLLSTALAISRDVAISDGDALLPSTRDLINDATGGEVFYHVTGPGGIYVTGYAYPPVGGAASDSDRYRPVYFEATYRGEPVRVLRITESMTIGNLTGDATVTVWQRSSDRNAFTRRLSLRAAALMGVLLVTLALVVWFGVQRGLRPLRDLHDAIALRTPDDLSRIKRAVPVEVEGIVATLNRLFGQVESSIAAHQAFISDASHQLRNPAAAILSMAESLREVRDGKERERRLTELIGAARDSARTAEQLLSLDRLDHDQLSTQFEAFNLYELTEAVCASAGAAILSKGLEFELISTDHDLAVHADPMLVSEAIKNLLDNARKHGGADLSVITVETKRDGDMATVTVWDDGVDLSPEDAATAFSRFGQLEPTGGSGLGLAIAASVAERHGGTLRINTVEKGASLTLALPIAG